MNWPVISSGRRSVHLWRELRNLQVHTQTHHSPDIHPPCGQKGQTCTGCTSLASPEVSVRRRPRRPCWPASGIARWIFATFEARVWIKSWWFIYGRGAWKPVKLIWNDLDIWSRDITHSSAVMSPSLFSSPSSCNFRHIVTNSSCVWMNLSVPGFQPLISQIFYEQEQ